VLLLQANEDYLTFDQPFIVTLGPDNGSLTTLEKGSRSTMVIVRGEGPLFTTLQVSTPH